MSYAVRDNTHLARGFVCLCHIARVFVVRSFCGAYVSGTPVFVMFEKYVLKQKYSCSALSTINTMI